jgi:hypothetical protein
MDLMTNGGLHVSLSPAHPELAHASLSLHWAPPTGSYSKAKRLAPSDVWISDFQLQADRGLYLRACPAVLTGWYDDLWVPNHYRLFWSNIGHFTLGRSRDLKLTDIYTLFSVMEVSNIVFITMTDIAWHITICTHLIYNNVNLIIIAFYNNNKEVATNILVLLFHLSDNSVLWSSSHT